MANDSSATSSKPTCFVIMGFGKKTDFETGRVLDLDKSYRNLIKPAVTEAGLECIRADEIVHSGLIDVPMYEQLLKADVVVADLSTSNKNALYELGIRHALRPWTTVVIAEEKMVASFDVNHIVIRSYRHLGEDIGCDEARRFQQLLTGAIRELLGNKPPRSDSPVYTYIESLTPPRVGEAAPVAASATTPATPATNAAESATHSVLMQQVDEAQKKGDFLTAKALLTTVRALMKQVDPKRADDPYVVQRLALVTYKSKHPSPVQALQEARELLAPLGPETSNDTETLGLWGAVHKRLWETTSDRAYLDESVRAYERGFYMRNDYYNGINFAFLLNVRAAAVSDPAEAVADFVQARRVRKEVVGICQDWLTANPQPAPGNTDALAQDRDSRYWVLATLAEAFAGLGDPEQSTASMTAARAVTPDPWMVASTDEQLAKLGALLADSPLKYLAPRG